jgi:EAL domain-containing protein (putative c-di-GMP-specific phosphodiesterase class I)/DNA-binding NarL/FixJ family response regulator
MVVAASARTSPDRITVLVADDDPSIRAALAAFLQQDARFAFVGSAASAKGAIQLAARSQPHVALVDFNMPGGGEQAVRGILAASPMTRVIALSGSDERTTVLGMLRAGARSYVVKGATPEEMANTILRAARGQSILSAEVASGLLGEAAAQLERHELQQSARLRLRERIEHAIHAQAFWPVFQPIFALATGVVVGFEALTRFAAEPHQPQRWFAAAAEIGLAGELELTAARAAGREFVRARPGGFLALNISPGALPRCIRLSDELAEIELVLEITEHAAIDDYGAVAPTLAELRERGVRLAVDDAGAGFASLRHTLQLVPDFLKLDVSLTRGIDSDRKRRALASGLVGFARELGAAIIAEGIETASELDTLRSLGVRYGQGYHLARPAPLLAARVIPEIGDPGAPRPPTTDKR